MIWVRALLGWLAFALLVASTFWWLLAKMEKRKSKIRVWWLLDKTYEIAADGKSIKCLACGRTSYHPEDVRQVYCGNCHRFHVR